MSELGGIVGRLAGAIADGEPVEWNEAVALARHPGEQAQLEQLRAIAQLHSRPRAVGPFGPTEDRQFGSPLWTLLLLLATAQVLTAIAARIVYGSLHTGRFSTPQLAICLAFATAAVVLIWGAGRDSRAARLGQLYLLIAAAFARPLVLASGVDAQVPGLAFLIVRAVSAEAFLPLALWQFGRQFPRPARFTTFDRASPGVTALMVLAGAALFLVNLMLSRPAGTLVHDVAMRFWSLRRNNGGVWFWIVVLSQTLPVLAASLWRLRSSAGEERRRATWFISAMAAGFVPLTASGVLLAASAQFRALMAGEGSARHVVDAVVLASIISMPFATAYAVLAQRLLTLRVAVHRSMRYALAKYTLVGLIALPVVVPAMRLYEHRDRRVDEIFGEPATLGSLGVMAAGVVLFSARRRLLNVLDRVLIGQSGNHARTLARVLAAISAARTPREVAFETASQIESALGVSPVLLFLCDDGGGVRTLHGVAPALAGNTALLAMLSEKTAVSVNRDSRLFRLLPHADCEWLVRARIETLVRIPMSHREVGGILGLGSRTHGIALTKADLAFVNAVATTAGLALSRPWSEGEDDHAPAAGEDVGAVECTNCGIVSLIKECSCAGSPRPALLPRVLRGRFEVVRRLGRGGMGVVYLANDVSLGRAVALKTLPQVSASAVAAMLDEARSMARVDHSNLALIYDVAIWRATPVLVVEYLSGGTLADALIDGPLPVREALQMGAALAETLSVLHEAEILHRDIKPSNVGFTRARTPKLLDFGIARLLARSDIEPGRSASGRADASSVNTAVAGTPLYLPPEALNGARPDVLVDLWGLALVVLEAVLGAYPFGASRRRRSQLPPQVAEFFARALHVSRERRPQTAASMALDLRAMAESTNVNVRIGMERVHAGYRT